MMFTLSNVLEQQLHLNNKVIREKGVQRSIGIFCLCLTCPIFAWAHADVFYPLMTGVSCIVLPIIGALFLLRGKVSDPIVVGGYGSVFFATALFLGSVYEGNELVAAVVGHITIYGPFEFVILLALIRWFPRSNRK